MNYTSLFGIFLDTAKADLKPESDAARLTGRRVGPLALVASNDKDEGRARNRRVELVKQ
jgi:flagellar motor protein MotB